MFCGTRRIKVKDLFNNVLSIVGGFTLLKFSYSLLYKHFGFAPFISKILGLDEKTGMYYIATKLHDLFFSGGSETHPEFYWAAFVMALLLSLFCFFLQLAKYYKPKMLIVEHSSLAPMKFNYEESLSEEYAIKKIQINQTGKIPVSEVPDEQCLIACISQIESKTKRILKLAARGYKVCYAGIANIPLTFLLGFLLGDENNRGYFHKRRQGTENDDYFRLLPYDPTDYQMQSDVSKNDPQMPGHLLLKIAISKDISDDNVAQLMEGNDYVIKYYIGNGFGYDMLTSSSVVEKYVKKIINDVSAVEHDNNITDVKICVAASSAFIFALGTRFSVTQDKNVKVYHFQNGHYPWGINMMSREIVYDASQMN